MTMPGNRIEREVTVATTRLTVPAMSMPASTGAMSRPVSRRRRVVAARREPGRLPSGVDAPHLHRHRGEPGDAQRQNRHEGGDGEGRLDGGSTAITGQTLVFSARLMMFVSALTIESPVTTV